jgi:hypothetical protein
MWRLARLAFWAIARRAVGTECDREAGALRHRPKGSGQSPIASYRRANAKHESQHAYCNKSIAKQIFLEVSGIDRQILEEIVSES